MHNNRSLYHVIDNVGCREDNCQNPTPAPTSPPTQPPPPPSKHAFKLNVAITST